MDGVNKLGLKSSTKDERFIHLTIDGIGANISRLPWSKKELSGKAELGKA